MYLVKLPSGMRPASREHNVAAVSQPFEAGITIDLQSAAESFEMSGWTLGTAIGAVDINRGRRLRSIPRSIIAGIDPEPAGLGAAAAGIEHRDRCVVGKQSLRGKDVRSEPCVQRLQPPDCATNPVGKCRAIQLDALPGEDLALPIKRKMIAILGDQNVGEETGSRQPLGDWPLRSRRLVNGAAGPAAIAWPADTDDAKPRRHMIEHLADSLADRMKRTAAAGTGLMLEIQPHVFTRQVCGQACPIGPFGPGRLIRRWRKLGLSASEIGFEVFKAKLQLLII